MKIHKSRLPRLTPIVLVAIIISIGKADEDPITRSWSPYRGAGAPPAAGTSNFEERAEQDMNANTNHLGYKVFTGSDHDRGHDGLVPENRADNTNALNHYSATRTTTSITSNTAPLPIEQVATSKQNLKQAGDDSNHDMISCAQNTYAGRSLRRRGGRRKNNHSSSSSSKSNKKCKGLTFSDSSASFSSKSSKKPKKWKKGKRCKKTKPIYTDVLVIGAGMAGIRAAARIHEVAPDLEVTVLEATDRIGGRVESFYTNDGIVLQKGANWLNPGGPSTSLYEQYVNTNGYVVDNPLNMTVYEIMCPIGAGGKRSLRDSNGVQKAKRVLERLHDDDQLDQAMKELVEYHVSRMMRRLAVEVCSSWRIPSSDISFFASKWNDTIVPCMNQVTLDFFFEVFDPEDDMGVIAELLACGWDEEDPLDFLFKVIYYDYEFGNADGSIFGWFDFAAQPILFTTDDWAKSIVSYAEENNITPVFEMRVMHIEYDLDNERYKARITAQDSDGKCVIYEAQRVISTVSAGVYNNGLITFDPPLLYSDAEYNPMKMRNYVKIFYRFSENFWGSGSHYIYPLTSGSKSTTGIFWQDLNRAELFPGSNILMLTLLEESFIDAVGERNVRNEEIPKDVLLSLLEPLRITFPDTFVEPCDINHSTYHADPNFGFGSYSNWESGYSPYDYFNFWGAYDFNIYIAPCDHNGCNRNNEWVLFLSGTSMCLNEWEYVDGAWYGGEFTANLMMESLGLDIGPWDQFCFV